MIVDALLEHLEDAIEDGEITPAANLGYFVRNASVPLEDDTSFLPFFAASIQVDDEMQTLTLESFSRETGEAANSPVMSVAELLDFVVRYEFDVSEYDVLTARMTPAENDEPTLFKAQTVGTFIDDEVNVFGPLEWFEGCEKELG